MQNNRLFEIREFHSSGALTRVPLDRAAVVDVINNIFIYF